MQTLNIDGIELEVVQYPLSLGRVLVLNANYEPITVCSVEKAVVLTYGEKAELIVARKNRVLRSGGGQEYPFPSVIRLKTYVQLPFKKIPLTRRTIFKRDNNECQYCSKIGGDLTIDHVVPRSRGGEDSWSNLVTACHRCNNVKGDQTPDEAGMKLKRHPVRPNHVTFLRQVMGKKNEDWQPYLFYDKKG